MASIHFDEKVLEEDFVFLQQEMEMNRAIMRIGYGSDEQVVLLRVLQLYSKEAIGFHHGLVTHTVMAIVVAAILSFKNTGSRMAVDEHLHGLFGS